MDAVTVHVQKLGKGLTCLLVRVTLPSGFDWIRTDSLALTLRWLSRIETRRFESRLMLSHNQGPVALNLGIELSKCSSYRLPSRLNWPLEHLTGTRLAAEQSPRS